MEGGYLSNAAVERSKQRLQRLPFIEKVDVETTPVPGTPDLVDVDFKIKEGLPGQFSGGIGYSQSQSVLLNGSFVHSNFLGTGNRVAAELNAGQYSQVYSLSHTDPYVTIDGVSRTVSLSYRNYSQFTTNLVAVRHDDRRAGRRLRLAAVGIPVRARRHRRAAVRPVHRSEPERRSSRSYWVQNNGNTYTRRSTVGVPPISFTYYGTRFDTFLLSVGLGLRLAQSRDLRRPRCAALAQLRLHGPGQRRRVLLAQLRLPAVRAAGALADDHEQLRGRLRQRHRLDHVDSAVPATSSRAARRACAASGRARSGRRTRSATRTAATSKLTNQFELLLPMPEKFRNSRAFQPVFRRRQRLFERPRDFLRQDQRDPRRIQIRHR